MAVIFLFCTKNNAAHYVLNTSDLRLTGDYIALSPTGLESGNGKPYASMALVDLAGAEYAAATEGKEDVRRLEGGVFRFCVLDVYAHIFDFFRL